MLRSFSFRSTASSPPPDKEMHEIIQPNSADDAMDTIRPPELTVVDDRTVQRPECPFIYALCTPTTHRPYRTMHRTLSHLKEKFIPHRAKRLINAERNNDYVVVDKPDFDHHLSPKDLIHPHESYDASHLFDMQATRSAVECDGPYDEPMESHQDLPGSASSTSASSSSSTTTTSSTTSSNHEFAGIDRTILDDTEYIRAQSVDLERVTMFEITQSRNLQSQRRLYGLDEAEEAAFLQSYSDARTKNARLQDELRRLTENYERMHSAWTCASCTYVNDPYSVTHLNICQMCESPSPSKQMMLMQ